MSLPYAHLKAAARTVYLTHRALVGIVTWAMGGPREARVVLLRGGHVVVMRTGGPGRRRP